MALNLNELGEVPVNCMCETEVRGLYAAGDVTNVPEKQIIIAAGEGAKAAIGAYNYLIARKLFEKKVPDESWSQSVEEKGGDA